ncbi:unnamed protein product [Lupinus luteus]|uniref:Uncharacterized protein n=1 Tax=Lupinus luteus TaxID=3873 RepID=A0AAV1YII0_LUPLU
MQDLRRCSNDVVHFNLTSTTTTTPTAITTTTSSFSIDVHESTEARIQRLISEHPVIIFTQSSCCMCHVMKKLLATIGVNPTVIELDHNEIAALPNSGDTEHHTATTSAAICSRTPAVFMGGASIGGLESLVALHVSGHLVPKLVEVGRVPTLQEGNMKENIFIFPWKEKPVVLGSRIKDAFQDPSIYVAIEPLFDKERYIVTYNPSKCKVYVVLKDQAKPDDILKAAFHAHVLLSFLNSANESKVSSWKQGEDFNSNVTHTVSDFEARIAESCRIVANSYGLFKNKANEQGWTMSESLLNPGRARLHQLDNR